MGGRIPQDFIDSLLDKTDIVQVIEQRVPLKRQGREFTACCPFHTEKTPSFTVSPQKQFYHCFGCGAHGSALGFLMEYENLSFVEAIEALAESLGLDVPREGGTRQRPQADHQPLYQALAAAAKYYQHQLRTSPAAIEYLKGRGLSGEISRDFRLGFAPDNWDALQQELSQRFPSSLLLEAGLLSRNDNGRIYDKFRNRIMFPIVDQRGRICAFGGRVLDSGEPKYLNSPETPVFNKSSTLFGLYQARQANARLDHYIIVEGYMDVVALAQAGIHNAVATLGTATTAEHIRMMLRGGVNQLVFCFDGDRAGRKAAWRALERALPVIRDGQTLRFLFLPEKDDPDSFVRREGKAAFLEAVAQARTLSTYLLETLKEKHNPATLEGRANINLEASALLKTLAAPQLRRQLDNALADLTHTRPASGNRGPKPPSRHAPRQRTVQMTPMRVAIATLLQHPEMADRLEQDQLARIQTLPGGELLMDLATRAMADANPTPAKLLERYRDTEHERSLHQLILWAPPGVETDGWHSLFDDALRQLLAQANRQRLNELLHASANRQLNTDEKNELKTLLEQER